MQASTVRLSTKLRSIGASNQEAVASADLLLGSMVLCVAKLPDMEGQPAMGRWCMGSPGDSQSRASTQADCTSRWQAPARPAVQ